VRVVVRRSGGVQLCLPSSVHCREHLATLVTGSETVICTTITVPDTKNERKQYHFLFHTIKI